ncbi:Alginate export [Marivirga sericea]|uniref:Alginate export n=2 Tax=Marivirga sericea TaxID=1028 RepID=A0A1X7L476_9BACT|nr:Alginate export [Marivirga sericea]
MKFIILLGCIFSIGCLPTLYAQEERSAADVPPIKQMRAEENYSFLEGRDSARLLLKSLKWMPISRKKNVFLSVGGQYRPRFEHFSNVNYTSENQSYFSQRLALNANLTLGKYFRVFGELYHGATSAGEIMLQSDVADWHQAFVEIKLPLKERNSLSFRFGRQEMDLGGSRLIGLREGPNIRQSFDLAKFRALLNDIQILAFYGTYVKPNFEAFDNCFDLFNSSRADPIVWSLGARLPLAEKHSFDVYYIGFQSDRTKLNDVVGKENRHSLGVRSFGNAGKRWMYNTEVIYQFGDLEGSRITAFNVETDWKYKLRTKIGTLLGLKLDISSGDREQGDDYIQTFNPLFVNPAIYSLAGLNTPANLTSLHPNITFIFDKMTVFIDYAFFYRTSLNDGLYAPPRFLIREGSGQSDRNIGDTFGLMMSYQLNRNTSFDLRTTYFIAGNFIEASGPAENTFYIAPTFNFRF